MSRDTPSAKKERGREDDTEAGDDAPPLVSVVVPAFQAADTLLETLESVSQQHFRSIEILIVDDGSTDQTAAVASAFCARDARARLIRRPNGGVAAARNCGLTEARGRYVAPIDADDLWHPDHLAKLVARARSPGEKPIMVYAPCRLIDGASRIIASGLNVPLEGRAIHRMLLCNLVGNGSGLLFDRKAAIALGGYDQRLRAAGCEGYEDYLLQLMLSSAGPIACVNEYLVGYRQRAGAMSRDLRRMSASEQLARTIHRCAVPLETAPVRLRRRQQATRQLLTAQLLVEANRPVRAANLVAGAFLLDPVAAATAISGRLRSMVRRQTKRHGGSIHFFDADPGDGGDGPVGRLGRPGWFARLQRRRLLEMAAGDRVADRPFPLSAVAGGGSIGCLAATLDFSATLGRAKPPKVSVVMPVHNGERFLVEAVRSILAQTFQDYELVIGDDGSDDRTTSILAALQQDYPGIRVVRRTAKSGLANAANWVVSHARGEFVAIAHCDDLAAPERLAEQVAALAADPDAVLVGSPAVGIDPAGKTIHPANLWRIWRPTAFAPFAHSSIMLRRSAFAAVDGYREQSEYWEDLDLYWRLSVIGRLLVLPRALTSYRYSYESTRERDNHLAVERSLQRLYTVVGNIADPASKGRPSNGRFDPRIFISRSWVHVWTGQPTNVLGRLLRHGRLGFNRDSLTSLAFVSWATIAPRSLRLALQVATVMRNGLVRLNLDAGEAVQWDPFANAHARPATKETLSECWETSTEQRAA
jgi:glycosyltransferase involved in cell wall biosynthesis